MATSISRWREYYANINKYYSCNELDFRRGNPKPHTLEIAPEVVVSRNNSKLRN